MTYIASMYPIPLPRGAHIEEDTPRTLTSSEMGTDLHRNGHAADNVELKSHHRR